MALRGATAPEPIEQLTPGIQSAPVRRKGPGASIGADPGRDGVDQDQGTKPTTAGLSGATGPPDGLLCQLTAAGARGGPTT